MDEAFELEEINNSIGISLPRSEQVDTIEFYKVHTNEPITELNTELCKYFIARHADTKEEYFALVFEKSNSYYVPWLSTLTNTTSYCLASPITYGITKISSLNEYCLVVIIQKYDYNNTLAKRLITSGPLSYEELNAKLIIPLTNFLQFCEKTSIEIGNISPNNIIFTAENKIILREFYTAPPHYFQDSHLLAPDIASCVPAGRITKGVAADIYALGILLIYAYTGNTLWSKHSEQQYNLLRLESGTFNTLAGKLKLEVDFKNLLKGLLHDNRLERWQARNIIDWINGKSTKLLSADNVDAISPIVFNDNNFQNCKALAHSMHLNWDNAAHFMKEERLAKWIQRSLVKTKITESINEIFSEQADYKYSYNQDRDESLFKVLTAFDPNGPMRLKSFAATVLSIPSVICVSLAIRRSDHLEAILKIIMKRFWSISIAKNQTYTKYGDYFQNIELATKYYNPTVPGFTIERMLYSLNPDLPCLSTNLGGNYVTSVAELLSVLDNLVLSNPQAPLADRHITGFIASKLNLKRELKISAMKNYPQIAQSPILTALNHIFLAHQQAPTVNINNLGNVIALRLVELFNEYLHNIKLKNLLKKDLITTGAAGNFGELISTISDTRLLENDFNGYKKACNEVTLLTEKIVALENRAKVSALGIFVGQRLTVLCSYLLIVLVCLILVF